MEFYLHLFTHIVVVMALGWYLITNLQWYNYKLTRVVLYHHKIQWHIIYFVTPFVLFYILPHIYFYIYFYLLYGSSFIIWNKSLDKPLVLTPRVKRFLTILLFTTFAIDALIISSNYNFYGLFLPLFITYIVSIQLEKIFFLRFKANAKKHLRTFRGMKAIAITASYGKTSIKNYLYQVLSKKYNVYQTPRSVNTIGGIVKDVNDDLPKDTDIYLVEAGAREQGDIEEIVNFIEPQYAIIGSVGEQHIEYFKTLDNIIHTKMEVLKSPRLIEGFVHSSVPILKYNSITTFPQGLNIVKSDLHGIWFDVIINGKVEHFNAPVLGKFNAINLTAVILVAVRFGMSVSEIKLALHNLKQVPHRLNISKVSGKVILDDSFNGNIDGMLEAVQISSTYEGRKVIVTPGIVESTIEANIKFAKEIEKVFDLVILTGSLNAKIIKKNISKKRVILLNNKFKMEDILIKETKIGDLILFANDAPNFI